eukprot:c5190_g1_i1.p1 GENE.c5190_g1_i1~~c5190_g1_i1.p1  ORF type:complete len:496 (+),score=115.41 c5190_g1_i1:48-1535(+)
MHRRSVDGDPSSELHRALQSFETQNEILHNLHDMVTSGDEQLEQKERDYKELKDRTTALSKSLSEEQTKSADLAQRLKAKEREVAEMHVRFRELEGMLEKERSAHAQLRALQQQMHLEADRRNVTIQDLEAQVQELKTKLELSNSSKTLTLSPTELNAFLQNFLAGLGLLSEDSVNFGSKLDGIIETLDQLHTKVDTISEVVKEVAVTTGFLAMMSVRISRGVNALMVGELEIPKLVRIVPRQPVDLKSIFQSHPEHVRDLEHSKTFFGKVGLASNLLKRKMVSKVMEEWEVQFVCAYDLQPIEMSLYIKVPKGWVIRAYPMLKLFMCLLNLARVASATVDRAVSVLAPELPNMQLANTMNHLVLEVESQLPPDVVNAVNSEISSELEETDTSRSSESPNLQSRADVHDVASAVYLELISVLDASVQNWRSTLASQMKKVMGEDGNVYWVSMQNFAKFTSPEAVSQRMMVMQQHLTANVIKSYQDTLKRVASAQN